MSYSKTKFDINVFKMTGGIKVIIHILIFFLRYCLRYRISGMKFSFCNCENMHDDCTSCFKLEVDEWTSSFSICLAITSEFKLFCTCLGVVQGLWWQATYTPGPCHIFWRILYCANSFLQINKLTWTQEFNCPKNQLQTVIWSI